MGKLSCYCGLILLPLPLLHMLFLVYTDLPFTAVFVELSRLDFGVKNSFRLLKGELFFSLINDVRKKHNDDFEH